MSGGVAVLHLWGVRSPAAAVLRVATDRFRLRRVPGLRFAKLLGTGSGETFTPRDADPRHWALLTTWDDHAAADAFDAGSVVGGWDRLAEERLTVRMRPLSSRGTWAGARPFLPLPEPDDVAPDAGPVAALTRARLSVRRAPVFWRAVPPVVAGLRHASGLRLSIGVGEAPVGFQGTFSLWGSARDLTAFAYRDPAHVDAMRRTPQVGWYAEELFARLAVLDVTGTYRGTSP